MGDSIKLSRDKHHRSSSSLTGNLEEKVCYRDAIQRTLKENIPEVEDQFLLSEARCDDLQAKLESVEFSKKKRKLKRRSITRMATSTAVLEKSVPLISVQTQPKQKVSSAQNARQRSFEMPLTYKNSYLDPATVEQHRMICAYNQYRREQMESSKTKYCDAENSPRFKTPRRPRMHAYGEDSRMVDDVYQTLKQNVDMDTRSLQNKKTYKGKIKKLVTPGRRAPVYPGNNSAGPLRNRQKQEFIQSQSVLMAPQKQMEERPIVELFNKKHFNDSRDDVFCETKPSDKRHTSWHAVNVGHESANVKGIIEDYMPERQMDYPEVKKKNRSPHQKKFVNRSYELPTVASQMKRPQLRYYTNTMNTTTVLPFIVGKSTEPSHNIGLNIQQVLSGLKMQQPVSKIPFTIAHHMGLSHVSINGRPRSSSTTKQMCMDSKDMNLLSVGKKQLILPTHKCISFNRLLKLYRDNEGVVSRFLRSMSRPNYFYTSLYNSCQDINEEDDLDAATSKGRSGCQEAKQRLAEYASLYREYEHVEKSLKKDGPDPGLQKRRDELTRELAARESHIRKVVQEYRVPGDKIDMRTFTSTMGDDSFHQKAEEPIT